MENAAKVRAAYGLDEVETKPPLPFMLNRQEAETAVKQIEELLARNVDVTVGRYQFSNKTLGVFKQRVRASDGGLQVLVGKRWDSVTPSMVRGGDGSFPAAPRVAKAEPIVGEQMDASGQAGFGGLIDPTEGQPRMPGVAGGGLGMTPAAAADQEAKRIADTQAAQSTRADEIAGGQAEMGGLPDEEPLVPNFGGAPQRNPATGEELHQPSGIEPPAAMVQSAEVAQANRVLTGEFPISEIHIMPSLFQLRPGVDKATGINPSHYLAQPEVVFDPAKQDPVILWHVPETGLTESDRSFMNALWDAFGVPPETRLEPPSGVDIMLSGHHRTNLAVRSGAQVLAADVRFNTSLATAVGLATEKNFDTAATDLYGYLNAVRVAQAEAAQSGRVVSDAELSRRIQTPDRMTIGTLLDAEAAGPSLFAVANAAGVASTHFRLIANIGYFARPANFALDNYKPWIDEEMAQRYYGQFSDNPAGAQDAIRRDYNNALAGMQMGMFADVKAGMMHYADVTAAAFQVIDAAKVGNVANKGARVLPERVEYGRRADEALDLAGKELSNPEANVADVLRRLFETLETPVQAARKDDFGTEAYFTYEPNLASKRGDGLGTKFAAFYKAAIDGAAPFDTGDVFTPAQPRAKLAEDAMEAKQTPPPQPVRQEEMEQATSTAQVEDMAARTVEEAQEVAVALDAPSQPITENVNRPLAALSPENLFATFREKERSLSDTGLRNWLMTLQENQLLEPMIAGAKQSSPADERRLRDLVAGDVVHDPPPPPTEAAAGGGDGPRIPRGGPPDGGGADKGRYGIPGEPRKQITVGDSGYGFDTLPKADAKLASMMRAGPWQKLADLMIEKVPGGAAIVRVVNASGGLSKAPIEARALIAREALAEHFDHDLAPALAWVEQVGTERAVWGVKNADGKVQATLADKSVENVYVQEIIEDPKKYKLTENQTEWMRRALEVTTLPRRMLDAMGKKVGVYNPGDEKNYTGLLLLSRTTAGQVVERGWAPMSAKRGLAGTAALTHERQFKTLAEALEAGFTPEPSYTMNMQMRMKAAGKNAVNIRLGEYIADWLKQASSKGAEGSQGISIRKNQGELGFGERLVSLQVNTPKGVLPHDYRIYGPKAQALGKFVDELKYEADLQEANVLLRTAAKVGSEIRFAVLTMDASVFTMQALLPMLAHPGWTAKSGVLKDLPKALWESLAHPDDARQARASLIAEFAADGGYAKHPGMITDYSGYSEFTEASGGVLGRLPVAGEGLQRFALSFDYIRDIIAVKWARLGDEAGMTGETLAAHDRMVNGMLGRLHSRALGVGPQQRMSESALFMLAPQYFRATAGMIAQMAEGGIAGRMAMKMLASAAGMFMMLVVGANAVNGQLSGQTPDHTLADMRRSMNPTAREFMTTKLDGPGEFDMRVGFGGMLKAMVSLMAELTVGEEFLTDGDKYGGNPLQARLRNAGRFGEARQAPAVNLLWQLASGEDFIGQDTSLTGQGAIRLASSNLLPIFLQSAIEDFDASNLPKSAGMLGAGVIGLNARDLSAGDVRERGAQQLYPSKSYDELRSWEKQWVASREWPKLQKLYADRAASQATAVSSANASLMRQDYRSEREGKLLSLSRNPSVTKFGLYSAWRGADDYERGQMDASGALYGLLFGERPADVPQDELAEAYLAWREILGEPDEGTRQGKFAAFNAQYPRDSEVGKYIRAQTNQRRVPMALLQRLSTYQKAQGVHDSAMVRVRMIYEGVMDETGDENAAQQASEAYRRWFFMLDEAAAVEQQPGAAPVPATATLSGGLPQQAARQTAPGASAGWQGYLANRESPVAAGIP